MKIINDWPPNISAIRAKFDLTGMKPVFAYGDILYNPHDCNVSDNLMVHEQVHQKQQMVVYVEKWWEKYLEDPVFRIAQEIEAYRAQYQYVKGQVKDRNVLARFLHQIASDLSSPMYGSAISYGDAVMRIKN